MKLIQRHNKTKEHTQNAELSRRISPLSYIGDYLRYLYSWTTVYTHSANVDASNQQFMMCQSQVTIKPHKNAQTAIGATKRKQNI